MLGRKKIGHNSFRRSGGPPLTRSISLKYTESKKQADACPKLTLFCWQSPSLPYLTCHFKSN